MRAKHGLTQNNNKKNSFVKANCEKMFHKHFQASHIDSNS